MADYMAAMLNELMGPTRNALPGESAGIDFDHSDICRDFLVGFCFHEAFRNTKNDIGYCPKPIHDEAMRKRYKESKRYGRLGYEEKFLDRARRFHADVHRKIEKNEERLRHTQGDVSASATAADRKREEIKQTREHLGKRIEKLMEEAQIEGEKGNVVASQAAVDQADALTKERSDLDRAEACLDEEQRRSMAFEETLTAGSRQMQVCQICGCFMLTNDAQQRIDDHLSGKLHIAYDKIGNAIQEMEKEREERRRKIQSENHHERERTEDKGRDRERERDREHRERRSTRRSRSRDRHDRDRRDRDRDRRDRRRSRSRDRRGR